MAELIAGLWKKIRPPPPPTREEQEQILIQLRIRADQESLKAERQLRPRVEQVRALVRPYGRAAPARLVAQLRAAEATQRTADELIGQFHLAIIMMEQATALQDGVAVLEDVMRVMQGARKALPEDIHEFMEDFRTQIDAVRQMQTELNTATRDLSFDTTVVDANYDATDARLQLTEEEEQRLLAEVEDLPAQPAPAVPQSRAPQPSRPAEEDLLKQRRAAILG